MRCTLSRLGMLMFLSVASNTLFEPLASARADAPDPKNSPDPVLHDYLSANGLLNRGLYELAAAEYRKFLSEHEDHEKARVARYGLGVSLFRMGKYEAAVEELAPLAVAPSLVGGAPSSSSSTRGDATFQYAAEVDTILGQCHLARQQYVEAAEAFKRVVRRHGDHDLADEAAAGLVEVLYLDGHYDEAIEECGRFVARWPDGVLRERTEFFGGLAMMARHDYADAAERFNDLLGRYPNGPFAQQASLLVAQCYQHRGLSLFDQGQFDRAFEMFKQVAEGTEQATKQRSNEATKGWSDEAAYWMAKCKLREGDFGEAARRLADAARTFPHSDLLPEMIYDRAIALLRAGQHDDAVEALKAFRSRFPEHTLAVSALHLLAATEHKNHRYDESRKHSRTFLEAYPSHVLAPGIAFLSAENDFLEGNYGEAVEGYRRFLARHDDDPQAGKARFRLGTALYRLQRFDEAESLLTEVTDGTDTQEVFRPALLCLGDIHYRRSEWKQAEKSLSDYLSFGLDMPSADDALLKLGLSRQRQGHSEEALEPFERLIARFEDSPHRLQAIFERGQALVSLERFDEAVEAFEVVLNEGGAVPPSEGGTTGGLGSRFAPHALNHLAAIATQCKQFEEAAALYERLAITAPGSQLGADALFHAGQALMAAQRFTQAESAFTRFLNQPLWNRLPSRSPLHARAAEARARRAIALARQNRHADAVEAIEQAEQQSGAKLDPSLRAALQYERAWCLRELGKSDEAAKAYRDLLDAGLADDFNTHAILELAGIEMNAKRFEEAARLLRRLRKIIERGSAEMPDEIRKQTTYRLGVCEFELGRSAEAARLLEEFVDAFAGSPLVASASFYCGEALFKQNRHERAVRHLTRVAEEFKDDPVFAPSLLRLGECLAALQRWAKSERVFAEYLDRFGDSEHWFQAQFGTGWARENQKRYDEAVSAYREVVARHPGVTAARAQFQIGECLFAQKRYGEAVRELLKVDILYAYPEWSAAALYEAGRCFERLGKPVEARTHFKQVTEQHKQTRWAELASRRLSEPSAALLPGR